MDTRLLAAIALLTASIGLRAATPEPFVAHEWGTFTSVQGGNGQQVQWTPLIKTDLPDFVYSRDVRNGGLQNVTLSDSGAKDGTAAFVRMETPVIYFYSDTERDIDVRVLFPAGRITEWYPQATRVGPYATKVKAQMEEASRSVIEWHGVKVLPRNTEEISASRLIRDREDAQAAHYYAARNTDANFLRVDVSHTGKRAEHERDLFYRGVGFAEAPLTVTLNADEKTLTLSTRSTEPLTDVFVLTLQHGKMRYQTIDRVTAKARATLQLDAAPFAAANDVRKRIMDEMVAALEQQGLYAKEARAMVATWQDQWFAEEGTRVLYLLPRAWTDRTLPLEISPRPDRIVRVMVGRAEVITPAMERGLRQQLFAFSNGTAEAQQQAVAATRELGLGRFLTPALQITLRGLGKKADLDVAGAAALLTDAVLKAAPASTHAAQSAAARTRAQRP
jgi:hypothetical protein